MTSLGDDSENPCMESISIGEFYDDNEMIPISRIIPYPFHEMRHTTSEWF